MPSKDPSKWSARKAAHGSNGGGRLHFNELLKERSMKCRWSGMMERRWADQERSSELEGIRASYAADWLLVASDLIRVSPVCGEARFQRTATRPGVYGSYESWY